MARPIVLDPLAPMRSLLDATGITIAEMARRRNKAPATISNSISTGNRVQLDMLQEAAELAGLVLEIRLKEKSTE